MSLIYFVGQDVPLTVTPTDDSGNPLTAPGAVSVAVTDPSGSVTTPAVSGPVSGAYTAVLSGVSLPGVWLVRWTATGWSAETQFQVRETGAEQLVDLPSVKAHLNIPPNDNRQDDELQGFILAAGEIARNHCGPFIPETHTQWFDGGRSKVVPDVVPISRVLSATEYYGLSAYPLTEQDLGGQTDAFAFTVDYSTGEITRRTFGGEAATFAFGSKNIKVVYTAGRAGAVPWTVRLGVLELIRHLWQMTQQGGGRPKFNSSAYDGGEAVIPTGFAIPSRVLELWQPYYRGPGIA
ncbi:hypothetical protein PV343_01445 [Streptomyces sp. WI03-4A]|uniref:hypothetical protein n=1 Tax=Streptomyces sp. WI03-4A TaxID=3028706 RepID=UPI0029A850EF|nr:hypothetical protein [Streptomyces sp. WI03-4A]MDX2590988.1 hypothetical protein [Streptomyces sp. WI03-4A]